MASVEVATELDRANTTGEEMMSFISGLYPICRSITGEGVRETLRRIAAHIPLTVTEVPSGTEVFDWVVPQEWNINDAYIKDSSGRRVVDFKASNLHVVGYSIPVRTRVTLEKLRSHLFSLPEHPDWVPYRTSYYNQTWGFCLSDRTLGQLKEEEYEVCIDSSLKDGSLTYAEFLIPGQAPEEVLISCHTCHPSLCNDNLSGIAVATFLAKALNSMSGLRFSYRFLFIPGTIGSITWLARNLENLGKIKHGLVLANMGDPGGFVYKKSRRGNAEIDRAMAHLLSGCGEVREFEPYGYDERQFCSPGINLPVGCLSRTPFGEFEEYHTSADNLDFVRPEALDSSLLLCLSLVEVLEGNTRFVNLNPMCEPQLGRRGLYRTTGGQRSREDDLALLWVLNLSDGLHDLLDVAVRSGLPFELIRRAADRLTGCGLLSPALQS